jgi:hypothetical protein
MRDLKQEAGNLFGDGIENGTVHVWVQNCRLVQSYLSSHSWRINVDNRTPSHHPCSS